MDLIALRNLDNRYLTLDDSNQRFVMRPGPVTMRQLFYRTPNREFFTYQPFLIAKYLTTSDDGRVFAGDVATNYSLTSHENVFLIYAGGKLYLTANDNGSVEARDRIGGTAQKWIAEAYDDVIEAFTGGTCCGKRPASRPQGDHPKLIFEIIIRPGIEVLRAFTATVAKALQAFMQPVETAVVSVALAAVGLLDRNGNALSPSVPNVIPETEQPPSPDEHPLHTRLKEGFRAAQKDAFADPTRHLGASLYTSHYYDPTTRQNFVGPLQPHTAYSHCAYWYKRSLERTDASTAAYRLGIALHFLIDVCKPMHVGNFMPLFGDPADGGGLLRDRGGAGRVADWRHFTFETAAHALAPQWAGKPPADIPAYPTIEKLLDDVSAQAHEIWRTKLQPLARAKVVTSEGQSRSIGPATNLWTNEEIGAVLADSVPLTQGAIASFVAVHDRLSGIRKTLPQGMVDGNACKWIFLGGGEWWPGGAQGSRDASLKVVTHASIHFGGEYDFRWGLAKNTGELRIEIDDIDALGNCTVRIRNLCTTGNILDAYDRAKKTGGKQEEWQEQTTRCTYRVSPDARRVDYFAGGVTLMTQTTMQRSGWKPGVQFDLQFLGGNYSVFLELRA